MTSGLGSCGKGRLKCTKYAISKAALNVLTVHQAGNLAEKGVRVVCLGPGWVKTRIGGHGTMIEAEDNSAGYCE
jgi:NAD(P)-dependent dehydrogenase (short-subunit alcohol dehydrogenase family)